MGVHRLIADELDLKPGTVYQAIKTIRLEMSLPPYNDPELHSEEFAEIRRKAQEAREAREAAKAAQAAAASLNKELASSEAEQVSHAEEQAVQASAEMQAETATSEASAQAR